MQASVRRESGMLNHRVADFVEYIELRVRISISSLRCGQSIYPAFLAIALLGMSCSTRSPRPSERMVYIAGSNLGVFDLSSGKDRRLFRNFHQTFFEIDFFDQDTVLVSAGGEQRGLSLLSLKTQQQKICDPIYPIRCAKLFSKVNTVVCYSIDSLNQFGIYTIRALGSDAERIKRVFRWDGGTDFEVQLRSPFIERISDSIAVFDDPTGALYVLNVELDSVADTGLRGFRPLAFRGVTGELICSDIKLETLWLVDLKKKAYKELNINGVIPPVLWVESVDGILFSRFHPGSVTEQTDLILNRFGDGSEEVLAENFTFLSGILFRDSDARKYLPG